MQPPLSGDAEHGQARRPGAPLLGAPSGPGARSRTPSPQGGVQRGAGIWGGGGSGKDYLPGGRGRRGGGPGAAAPRLGSSSCPCCSPGRVEAAAPNTKAKLPARPSPGPGPGSGPGGGGVGPRPRAGVGGGCGARGRSWEETFAPVPTPPRRAALWAPAAPGPAWARLLKGPRRCPAPQLTRRRRAGAARGGNWSLGAWSPHWVSLWLSPSGTHMELWGIVTGPESYPPGTETGSHKARLRE